MRAQQIGIGIVLFVTTATAAERNVDGIMDNSFLVEEAYNQEPSVVQHILTGFFNVNQMRPDDDRAWDLSFTQEWPLFSQKHQLSYTVPYSFIDSGVGNANGFGDVLLNYRYQAYFDQESLIAFAPRFSVVLPTGDEDEGLGDDTVGFQLNLPFSTAIGDKWFVHANAGLTWLPDAGARPERDLTHYNLGASGIYAMRPDLHFMLEWIGQWNEEAGPGGSRDLNFESLISPGIRKAFDVGEAQWVLGLAAPIGVTGAAPDYGVFLYVSFEHPFSKE